jgi:hypothetical protein
MQRFSSLVEILPFGTNRVEWFASCRLARLEKEEGCYEGRKEVEEHVGPEPI